MTDTWHTHVNKSEEINVYVYTCLCGNYLLLLIDNSLLSAKTLMLICQSQSEAKLKLTILLWHHTPWPKYLVLITKYLGQNM